MALKFSEVFSELNKAFGTGIENQDVAASASNRQSAEEYLEGFDLDDYESIYPEDVVNVNDSSGKRMFEDSDSEDVIDNNIIFDIVRQNEQNEIELTEIKDVLSSIIDSVCDDKPKDDNVKAKQPAKRRRISNVSDRRSRDLSRHPLLEPCLPIQIESGSKKGCLKKCSENFTEEHRNDIHKFYWQLSKEEQFRWIINNVETISPERPRTKTSHIKERKVTRVYYLEDISKKRVHVCQKMFLSTLGLTNDKTIKTALDKSNNGSTIIANITDNRGTTGNQATVPDEHVKKIKEHILSYNPSISHYRRAHAPNRLYISPKYNRAMMYKDFCESNPHIKVSSSFYRSEIKKMNINFVKLGEEECEKCDLHKKHLEISHGLTENKKKKESKKTANAKTSVSKPAESGTNKIASEQEPSTNNPSSSITNVETVQNIPNEKTPSGPGSGLVSTDGKLKVFQECKDCKSFESHIKTAKEARNSYREDRDKIEKRAEELIVSVDMQKVIMLPRLPGLKVVVFCKRTVLFNETFAPLGKGKQATGVIWHEGVKGRSAAEVASTYTAFIKSNRDVKDFVFWVDNCSGQNKNWFLFTALANEVNVPSTSVQSITLKYFEPGHTFMSADSFHHKVEQAMKQKKRV